MDKNVAKKVKNLEDVQLCVPKKFGLAESSLSLEDASDDLKETHLKGGHSCRSLGRKTWLITERAMNYKKIKPDFISVIKRLDGREVKVNGEVVERIDETQKVSCITIDGTDISIDIAYDDTVDDEKYSFDKLEKMLNRHVRIKDVKDKSRDNEEKDNRNLEDKEKCGGCADTPDMTYRSGVTFLGDLSSPELVRYFDLTREDDRAEYESFRDYLKISEVI